MHCDWQSQRMLAHEVNVVKAISKLRAKLEHAYVHMDSLKFSRIKYFANLPNSAQKQIFVDKNYSGLGSSAMVYD